MGMLVWIVIGLILAGIELAIGELTLLMLGIAAIGTGLIAGVTDMPVVAEVLVIPDQPAQSALLSPLRVYLVSISWYKWYRGIETPPDQAKRVYHVEICSWYTPLISPIDSPADLGKRVYHVSWYASRCPLRVCGSVCSSRGCCGGRGAAGQKNSPDSDQRAGRLTPPAGEWSSARSQWLRGASAPGATVSHP